MRRRMRFVSDSAEKPRPEDALFRTAVRVLVSTWVSKTVTLLVAAMPLFGAYLYLAGSVGRDQYFAYFALPTGLFEVGLQETLTYGYLATTSGIMALPGEAWIPIGMFALIPLLYFVFRSIDQATSGRATPRYLEGWPKLEQALERLLGFLIALPAVVAALYFALALVILLPVFGALGGEAHAVGVHRKLFAGCSPTFRCIEFRDGKQRFEGRLIASSANHIALLLPESFDVVVLTTAGKVVARSSGGGVERAAR